MSESTKRVFMQVEEEVRIYVVDGTDYPFEDVYEVGIKRNEYGEDSHVIHCKDGTGAYFSRFDAIIWHGKDATQRDFSEKLNAKFQDG